MWSDSRLDLLEQVVYMHTKVALNTAVDSSDYEYVLQTSDFETVYSYTMIDSRVHMTVNSHQKQCCVDRF